MSDKRCLGISRWVSRRNGACPIRFSLTAQYLNRWKFDYIDNTDKSMKGILLLRRWRSILSSAWILSRPRTFWVGVGFNPKVNMDMKLKGGGSFSGFSAGAGVRIKMFDVGFSLAKYHPSAMSMMISVSTTLADFKKVTE